MGETSDRDSPETSPPADKPIGPLLRVRVVETAHGLRLGDSFEPAEGSDTKETAARIAERVVSVVGKIGQPRGQVIPLGIIDIHSVQLPVQHERLARLLPALLSAPLGREPRLLVLERENLGVLLREKQLTAGEDTTFWNSAVLIDGYVQPDTNTVVQMHLRLRAFDGRELQAFTVPVDPNAPACAVEQAAAKIRATIGNAPASSIWNAAQEAEEFSRQGQLLYAHRRYAEALPPLEVAHALQPGNVSYTGALFTSEWTRHPEATQFRSVPPADPSQYSDLEVAELAALFVRQVRDACQKGELSAQDIYRRGAGGLLPPSGMPRGYFGSPLSATTEQVRHINRTSRKIWVETLDQALRQQPVTPLAPRGNRLLRAHLVWISADEPEELLANVKKAFTELILRGESDGQTLSIPERNYLYDQIFSWSLATSEATLRNSQLRGSSTTFARLWQEYLTELSHSDDPVVRFNSCQDLALAGMQQQDEQGRVRARAYACEALQILAGQLRAAPDAFSDNPYTLARRLQKNLAVLRLPPEESLRLWTSVYEPLVKNNNAVGLSLWNPGLDATYLVYGPPGVVQGWYDLLERVGAVLPTRLDEPQVAHAMSCLQAALAELRVRYPQLTPARASWGGSVAMLLRKNDWLIPPDVPNPAWGLVHEPVAVELDREMLWISFVTNSNYLRMNERPQIHGMVVGLAGINLAKRQVMSLWQAATVGAGHHPMISGLALGRQASYASVTGLGLVVFPGVRATGHELYADCNDVEEARRLFPPVVRLGPGPWRPEARGREGPLTLEQRASAGGRASLPRPKVLTQDRGLPSLQVTSIAREGEKLWIAYGGREYESGLGVYEPGTGRWNTVFCSTLPGEPPFGSGKPYLIDHLRTMPADKLVFTLEDFTTTALSVGRRCGFWSLDTATRRARFMGLGDAAPPARWPVVLDVPGKWWLWSPDRGSCLVEFDPVAETWKRIEGEPFGGWSRRPPGLGAVAIHDDTLWALMFPNQLVIAGRGKDSRSNQFLDNRILDGDPVLRFLSTPYGLVAIGYSTVGLVETVDGSSIAPK